MHDQINRSTPPDIGLVVEPAASRDDDVMPFGLRTERRFLALHVESVIREHIPKRRVTNLVSELGDVHNDKRRYSRCAWLWVLMMRRGSLFEPEWVKHIEARIDPPEPVGYPAVRDGSVRRLITSGIVKNNVARSEDRRIDARRG